MHEAMRNGEWAGEERGKILCCHTASQARIYHQLQERQSGIHSHSRTGTHSHEASSGSGSHSVTHLEHATEGALTDVADVDDIVARKLQSFKLGVQLRVRQMVRHVRR